MTPEEYVTEIVLPTVQAFLDSPGDRLKGYLAAIVTYHITDYVMRTTGVTSWNDRRTETQKIEDAMKARHLAEFEIIEGMCHGTKHCGRDRGDQKFKPGDETPARLVGFGHGYAGFDDDGRLGKQGLRVEHNGGSWHFVDDCLVTVLTDFKAEYSPHLSNVSLSFLQTTGP